MTAPISAHFSNCQHFACADLVRIDCVSAGASEQAILLEIWEAGAVLETSFALAKGSFMVITVNRSEINAVVTSCEPDYDFGYLIEIAIDAPGRWFPRVYVPEWHTPAMDSIGIPAELVC